ncbi:MAG: hypothetical protein WDW38_011292 [Sanguina aurantia]
MAPGSLVLVVGATGGVGQIVTTKLLERGFRVRAIDRGSGRAASMFKGRGPELEIVKADLRDAATLTPQLMEGVGAVVCSTGTTAFPSTRWDGNNGPRPTDFVGPSNLIAAVPRSISRFVLVTSAGVERPKGFPWFILNTFGVLKYKRETELLLQGSGLPYTLIRPNRLTDGPYTSFDLNTLLKSTAGKRQAVTLSKNDDLPGEASRIAVAELAVQAMMQEGTANKAFSISSVEGDGPGTDSAAWNKLFTGAYR